MPSPTTTQDLPSPPSPLSPLIYNTSPVIGPGLPADLAALPALGWEGPYGPERYQRFIDGLGMQQRVSQMKEDRLAGRIAQLQEHCRVALNGRMDKSDKETTDVHHSEPAAVVQVVLPVDDNKLKAPQPEENDRIAELELQINVLRNQLEESHQDMKILTERMHEGIQTRDHKIKDLRNQLDKIRLDLSEKDQTINDLRISLDAARRALEESRGLCQDYKRLRDEEAAELGQLREECSELAKQAHFDAKCYEERLTFHEHQMAKMHNVLLQKEEECHEQSQNQVTLYRRYTLTRKSLALHLLNTNNILLAKRYYETWKATLKGKKTHKYRKAEQLALINARRTLRNYWQSWLAFHCLVGAKHARRMDAVKYLQVRSAEKEHIRVYYFKWLRWFHTIAWNRHRSSKTSSSIVPSDGVSAAFFMQRKLEFDEMLARRRAELDLQQVGRLAQREAQFDTAIKQRTMELEARERAVIQREEELKTLCNSKLSVMSSISKKSISKTSEDVLMDVSNIHKDFTKICNINDGHPIGPKSRNCQRKSNIPINEDVGPRPVSPQVINTEKIEINKKPPIVPIAAPTQVAVPTTTTLPPGIPLSTEEKLDLVMQYFPKCNPTITNPEMIPMVAARNTTPTRRFYQEDVVPRPESTDLMMSPPKRTFSPSRSRAGSRGSWNKYF